jgi:hypothetical protein
VKFYARPIKLLRGACPPARAQKTIAHEGMICGAVSCFDAVTSTHPGNSPDAGNKPSLRLSNSGGKGQKWGVGTLAKGGRRAGEQRPEGQVGAGDVETETAGRGEGFF